METQILAETLKKALKSKGINQEKLSELLGISERSVNRILTGGTLTTDRLFEICKVMGITLKELLLMEEGDLERMDFEFTIEQEEFFVINWTTGLFYTQLFTFGSVKELAKHFNIDDVSITKMLSDLEKLNLLKWLPGNEVQLYEPRKFNRQGGPVYKAQAKRFAHLLVDKSLSNEKDPLFLIFPNLSETAIKKFRIKLKELFLDIKKEREIETLLKIPTETVGVLLCMEPAELDYEKLQDLRL